MATMAVIPGTISPLVQITHQSAANKPRIKTRLKNVTWATKDKLCQVRLFAAEDAPSLSGTVLQDLLQAKRSGFMHALIPVSEEDLPPGFEAVATNRTHLDTEAIKAMVAQITWQHPKKVVYDPTWQVAVGTDSAEVPAEQQREVRMLEAIYPRPSTIPSSPAEPQETYADVKDDLIPQIPLTPFEDEDQGMEESSPGSKTLESASIDPFDIKSGVYLSSQCLEMTTHIENSGSGGQPGGLSSGCTVVSNMNPKAAQPNSGLSASNSKSSVANVAAATAAAYTVLKAKESGLLIDHELLIKILNNPDLMESLMASDTKKKTHYGNLSSSAVNAEASGGNGFNVVSSLPSKGSNIAAGDLGSQIVFLRDMQGGTQGASRMHSWDGVSSPGIAPQGRPFLASASQEQFKDGMIGMRGQVKGTFRVPVTHSPSFPPREEILKELIQQHGMAKSNNEIVQPKHGMLATSNGVKPGVDIDWHGGLDPGSRGQLWMGNNQTAPSLYLKNDAPLHERIDVEVPRTKSRKPCLYFDTPRGCRNGINCYFMHETAAEKTSGRTRIDVSQLQQEKKQKLDTAHR